MRLQRCSILIAIPLSILHFSCNRDCHYRVLLKDSPVRQLTISYPADSTVFPPEAVAPIVRWKESSPDANALRIRADFREALTNYQRVKARRK